MCELSGDLPAQPTSSAHLGAPLTLTAETRRVPHGGITINIHHLPTIDGGSESITTAGGGSNSSGRRLQGVRPAAAAAAGHQHHHRGRNVSRAECLGDRYENECAIQHKIAMANLNLRNLGGNSLARSSISFGGNNSLSGHVTPVFGQRATADRRTLPIGNNSLMGNMALGGYSALHTVFGSGDTNAPPLLDLSEFPSLTNRSAGENVPQPNPMPGAKPYVGMVKQPTSEASEFTMSNEDFPALPGTQNRDGLSPGNGVGDKGNGGGGDGCVDRGSEKNNSKTGIQTYPDGLVTNIPASMVNDQFGIVGLLTFIRAAETDPNLVSLALGQDLTALGLNLNSPDNLHPTFGGPWAEQPCRPQDIDFHVPPEYLINTAIRDKLASVKLNRYKDDLLFFMFYNNVGDVLQIAAASELYTREWRYHMEEKVWITQVPGVVLMEKTSTYERGTYYFFDAQNWRKVAKEFLLDYSKLEGRPMTSHHLS